jgi:hypothetical protein
MEISGAVLFPCSIEKCGLRYTIYIQNGYRCSFRAVTEHQTCGKETEIVKLKCMDQVSDKDLEMGSHLEVRTDSQINKCNPTILIWERNQRKYNNYTSYT